MNMRAPLLALGFSLCLQFAAQAQTVLRVSGSPVQFKTMFTRLVDTFEKQNPDIKVALDIPPGDQPAMIEALLRRALVGDLPDVTFQGYDYLRTVVARGLAVPLDSFVKADPDWKADRYSDAVLHSATLDGHVYGLGSAFSFPVIFYNADLAEAALAGKPFPTSWDAILALGAEISRANPGALGVYMRPYPWIFQTLLETNHAHFMGADDKTITFDGPEGVAAFSLLARIGAAGQARSALNLAQARQSFSAGSIAILTDASSGLSQRIKDIGGRFKVGIAPFPGADCPHGCIPAAGVATVMTTKDPAHQQAAWRFMKFVIDAQGQTIIAQESSYVPANDAAIAHDKELKAAVEQYPQMKAVVALVAHASAWYAFPGPSPVKVDDTIEEVMQLVVEQKEKPAEALADLRKRVEPMLAQ